MSPLGSAIAQNGPLSRHIMDRLSHLTAEERRRGYFEVPLGGKRSLFLRLALIEGQKQNEIR